MGTRWPSRLGKTLSSVNSIAALADNQGELLKLISLIDFLKGAGFFNESLELAEDVEVSLSERPLKEEESIFIFQSCFAKVLAEIGQFDRAEELLHSVLAGRQSRLGRYKEVLLNHKQVCQM